MQVLEGLQARGAIGTTALAAAVAHAERFVTLVPAGARRLADLGSGGGLPGLVIAVRRPDLEVVLIERRTNRADQLRRAVSALRIGSHVSVQATDVSEAVEALGGTCDVATARSFGAPSLVAKWGSALLREGGLLIVSEPPVPGAERWPAKLLERHGLDDDGLIDGVRRLRRR